MRDLAPSIETIWDNCANTFRRMAIARLRNSDDMEDCVQEIFAKIISGIEGQVEPGCLDAWLYAVARNTISDCARRHRREPMIEAEIAQDECDDFLEQRAALSKWVPIYVRKLRPEYRDAVVLCHLCNYRFEDVARVLNLSVSGAKSRVQRGRKLLAQMLATDCPEEVEVAGYRGRRWGDLDPTRSRT